MRAMKYQYGKPLMFRNFRREAKQLMCIKCGDNISDGAAPNVIPPCTSDVIIVPESSWGHPIGACYGIEAIETAIHDSCVDEKCEKADGDECMWWY